MRPVELSSHASLLPQNADDKVFQASRVRPYAKFVHTNLPGAAGHGLT
jgi:hypothetical protein